MFDVRKDIIFMSVATSDLVLLKEKKREKKRKKERRRRSRKLVVIIIFFSVFLFLKQKKRKIENSRAKSDDTTICNLVNFSASVLAMTVLIAVNFFATFIIFRLPKKYYAIYYSFYLTNNNKNHLLMITVLFFCVSKLILKLSSLSGNRA